MEIKPDPLDPDTWTGDRLQQQNRAGQQALIGNPYPMINAEFHTALAKAQAEMTAAKFDSTNPHFKSKFASLASVNEVARVAARHGIAYVQTIEQGDEGIRCITMLLHTHGVMQSYSPWFRPAKADAHGIAGACTYARRIGLSLAFCITSDQDDDGNAAVAKPESNIDEDLGSQALTKAADGGAAYSEWWSGLTKDQKRSLGSYHEAAKRIAAKVDHLDGAANAGA